MRIKKHNRCKHDYIHNLVEIKKKHLFKIILFMKFNWFIYYIKKDTLYLCHIFVSKLNNKFVYH